MAFAQDLDSGVNNPSAFTFSAAALDGVMPDASAAKVQVVVLGYTTNNGDGTYNVYPVGLEQYLPVNDGGAAPLLEEVRDATVAQASDISAIASYNLQNIATAKVNGGQSTYGATVPISLSDTTPTDLFVTANDDSRIDLIGLVITNLDTADAVVDFACDTQVTPIAVRAGETLPVNVIIRGIINTSWAATLRANPATTTVEITATARIAPSGF